MHNRAKKSNSTTKNAVYSNFSQDFTKDLAVVSSVESSEGIVSENSFAAALDGLLEKSTGVREASYMQIAGLLQSHSIPEYSLEENQMTLSEAIKKSLRNSSTERSLASKTAGLFAICVGADCASFYDDLKVSLEGALSSSKDGLTKGTIIQSLATLCFVMGDNSESLLFIEKCHEWLSISDPLVELAAITSISICCSALSPSEVNNTIIPKYAKKVASMVSPSNQNDVRLAAAKAVCLFYEFHWDTYQETPDCDPFELDGFMDVTQLFEDLQDYTGRNKEEQKRLTIEFEGLLQSIEEGFCPFHETLTVKHVTNTYDDWCSVLQIEWLRDQLRGGFLTQLTGNDLLHQIFDLDPALFLRKVVISKEEKREFKSKNSVTSKERSKTRRKEQRKGLPLD